MRDGLAVDLPSEDRFFEVVRAGFRAPRKQLHNSLAMGLWMEPGGAKEWLEECEIDPMPPRRHADAGGMGRAELGRASARARPSHRIIEWVFCDSRRGLGGGLGARAGERGARPGWVSRASDRLA